LITIGFPLLPAEGTAFQCSSPVTDTLGGGNGFLIIQEQRIISTLPTAEAAILIMRRVLMQGSCFEQFNWLESSFHRSAIQS
jgi:hypothetical protein